MFTYPFGGTSRIFFKLSWQAQESNLVFLFSVSKIDVQ